MAEETKIKTEIAISNETKALFEDKSFVTDVFEELKDCLQEIQDSGIDLYESATPYDAAGYPIGDRIEGAWDTETRMYTSGDQLVTLRKYPNLKKFFTSFIADQIKFKLEYSPIFETATEWQPIRSGEILESKKSKFETQEEYIARIRKYAQPEGTKTDWPGQVFDYRTDYPKSTQDQFQQGIKWDIDLFAEGASGYFDTLRFQGVRNGVPPSENSVVFTISSNSFGKSAGEIKEFLKTLGIVGQRKESRMLRHFIRYFTGHFGKNLKELDAKKQQREQYRDYEREEKPGTQELVPRKITDSANPVLEDILDTLVRGGMITKIQEPKFKDFEPRYLVKLTQHPKTQEPNFADTSFLIDAYKYYLSIPKKEPGRERSVQIRETEGLYEEPVAQAVVQLLKGKQPAQVSHSKLRDKGAVRSMLDIRQPVSVQGSSTSFDIVPQGWLTREQWIAEVNQKADQIAEYTQPQYEVTVQNELVRTPTASWGRGGTSWRSGYHSRAVVKETNTKFERWSRVQDKESAKTYSVQDPISATPTVSYDIDELTYDPDEQTYDIDEKTYDIDEQIRNLLNFRFERKTVPIKPTKSERENEEWRKKEELRKQKEAEKEAKKAARKAARKAEAARKAATQAGKPSATSPLAEKLRQRAEARLKAENEKARQRLGIQPDDTKKPETVSTKKPPTGGAGVLLGIIPILEEALGYYVPGPRGIKRGGIIKSNQISLKDQMNKLTG